VTNLPTRIPDEADWDVHESDLDAKYSHKRLLGRSIDDVMYEFRDQASEIFIELAMMPRRAFQYYIFAFVQLLNSPGEGVAQSDCASGFLNVLRYREERDPGSVAEIYLDLRATVDCVAANQAFFDADIGIYGDFRERAAELNLLFEAPPNASRVS
jgi:hypothetical protein